MPTVVLLSRDQELANLRKKVLEDNGCTVRIPQDKAEAHNTITSDPPDVLLISYSISAPSAQFFASLYRHMRPDGRVVSILDSPISPCPPYATVHINKGDAPYELIAAVLGHR